jgi:hypothetical protein
VNASDPNFCILLLLGGAILYGLAPAYGAFALAIAGLWLAATAPLLFFALAGIWLLRWLIADFLLFLIGGYAAGLGFGRATRPRYPRRTRWSRAELDRNDVEGRRAAPRLRGRREGDYQPFDDPLDMG